MYHVFKYCIIAFNNTNYYKFNYYGNLTKKKNYTIFKQIPKYESYHEKKN